MRSKAILYLAVAVLGGVCVGGSFGQESGVVPATRPAATEAAALAVGDPAPPLQVSGWVKGTPVKAFEPGRIYVVEFWATWCGPCTANAPHLSELTKKFVDKVTVVGVSILEEAQTNADVEAAVRPFVEKMGDKMAYNVAFDGAAGAMAANWFKASHAPGIPEAYVIDGNGRIAWMGHPALMEPVLTQITAGTWDAAAERRLQTDRAEILKQVAAERADILKTFAAKDDAATLALIQTSIMKIPILARDLDVIRVRLTCLYHTDAAGAANYVRSLSTDDQGKRFPVYAVLKYTSAVPAASSVLKPADWQTIANIFEPTMTAKDPVIDENSYILDFYADLLLKAGDRDGAIAYRRKALGVTAAALKALPDTPAASAHDVGLRQACLAVQKQEQADLDTLLAKAN